MIALSNDNTLLNTLCKAIFMYENVNILMTDQLNR